MALQPRKETIAIHMLVVYYAANWGTFQPKFKEITPHPQKKKKKKNFFYLLKFFFLIFREMELSSLTIKIFLILCFKKWNFRAPKLRYFRKELSELKK